MGLRLFSVKGSPAKRLPTAAVVVLAIVVSAIAITTARADMRLRTPAAKPDLAVIRPGFDRGHVEVKFVDDLDIGLDAKGTPIGRKGQALASAHAVACLTDIESAGGRWQRMPAIAESSIDQLRARAEENLQREIADLNNYFILEVPDGVATEAWLNKLNALDDVEIALALPLPARLPVPGDFSSEQGYLDDAPDGIGARTAWLEDGGYGSGCFGSIVCDFEYSWNLDHEDITASYNELIPDGMTASDPQGDDNHGTAVLGELSSFNNGWGTVGASPGITTWAAPTYLDGAWQLGTSLTHVLNLVYWRPGSVFLIEQQMAGPRYTGASDTGLVPIEWWESWYNTVLTCVGNGVTVVAAAGNGFQNLDDPIYQTGHAPFMTGNHSGAIIVGAGAAPSAYGGTDVDRSRLAFSNYGSRVDMQGWGERVTTTGYGWRYDDEGKDYWYDSTFAGTSSAAPNVASAVAILQSIYKVQGNCSPYDLGTALSPDTVRAILISSGSPQQAGTFPVSQHIGPRPNLAAAIPLLPDDFGACCRGTECTIEAEYGCTTGINAGVYQGDYTTCDPNPCLSCCIPPMRGNVDGSVSEEVTLGDLTALIDYLFVSFLDLPCWEEANVDASQPEGETSVTLGDLTRLIDHLFVSFDSLPPCGTPSPPPPQGTVSGEPICKTMPEGLSALATPPDQDCLQWDYDGAGHLVIEHINTGLNCCPVIVGEIDIDGSEILITQIDSLDNGGCYCLCLFDITYDIENLPPGQYHVRVIEPYRWETDPELDVWIDLVAEPQGEYCEPRTVYPWTEM